MKNLVETNGEFQLVDFGHGGQMLHAHRPSVITMTTFIQGRVALGQVTVHGEVAETATDEEFATYWAEKPEEAVEDFLLAFAVVKETTKDTTPKAKRGAK